MTTKIFYLSINLIFFLSVFGKINAQETKFLTAGEFVNIIIFNENEVIIDVSEWADFKKKRIENATFAENSEQLKIILNNLDREQPILIYCADGTRSLTALSFVEEMQFQQIFVLRNGLNSWAENLFPIDKNKVKPQIEGRFDE